MRISTCVIKIIDWVGVDSLNRLANHNKNQKSHPFIFHSLYGAIVKKIRAGNGKLASTCCDTLFFLLNNNKNSDMSVRSSEDLKAVDNSEAAVLCSNLEA